VLFTGDIATMPTPGPHVCVPALPSGCTRQAAPLQYEQRRHEPQWQQCIGRCSSTAAGAAAVRHRAVQHAAGGDGAQRRGRHVPSQVGVGQPATTCCSAWPCKDACTLGSQPTGSSIYATQCIALGALCRAAARRMAASISSMLDGLQPTEVGLPPPERPAQLQRSRQAPLAQQPPSLACPPLQPLGSMLDVWMAVVRCARQLLRRTL